MPEKEDHKKLKLIEDTEESSSSNLKLVMDTIQKRIETMNKDIQEMDSDAKEISEYFEYSGPKN